MIFLLPKRKGAGRAGVSRGAEEAEAGGVGMRVAESRRDGRRRHGLNRALRRRRHARGRGRRKGNPMESSSSSLSSLPPRGNLTCGPHRSAARAGRGSGPSDPDPGGNYPIALPPRIFSSSLLFSGGDLSGRPAARWPPPP